LSIKRYGALLAVNAAALLVSCVLTLILAASKGGQGAALATLLGESTLAVGYILVLLQGHPELRPNIAVLPKVLLAAIPAAALALSLRSVPSVVLTVIVLAVYGLIILVTRATPREITELIPRFRRGPATDPPSGRPAA
jgi:Na+-driven multidrug efflux pump